MLSTQLIELTVADHWRDMPANGIGVAIICARLVALRYDIREPVLQVFRNRRMLSGQIDTLILLALCFM
jgi:hypothetical protein